MLAASHMDSAEIVFTTLSSTGRRAFERGRKFDLVLIDEAAQASEAATLQPLTLGSGKYALLYLLYCLSWILKSSKLPKLDVLCVLYIPRMQ